MAAPQDPSHTHADITSARKRKCKELQPAFDDHSNIPVYSESVACVTLVHCQTFRVFMGSHLMQADKDKIFELLAEGSFKARGVILGNQEQSAHRVHLS